MNRLVPLAALAFIAAAPSPSGYASRVRRELDSYAVKIEALQAEAHTLGAEARERAEERIAVVRLKKSDADRLLAKLDASAGKAGKEVRVGLDRALRDLKTAYSEAASK